MAETTSRKRILVVDDEEDVQILIRRILSDAGYDVDSASDGEAALERIEDRRPDLVVLDLMMPGMDGWGVLENLRKRPDPPPVVVVTALADYQAFTRGVREGAAAYVCKPFHFAELVATCQKVLLAGATRGPLAAEQRRESRRRLVVEVQVLSHGSRPVAVGELVNLSPGGAQVDLGVALELGDRVRVAFSIPGSGFPVGIEGRVQWRLAAQRGFSHGLVFVSLTPAQEQQLRELLQPSA
jgi:DNA-binding response OmpR family regulator